MSVTPQMQGLSLDQAPPLAIPSAFFVTAPISVIGAGVIMAVSGGGATASPWLPVTLGLTHLGTLGFLAMVMLGAVYQMLPVVVGERVPAIRLAWVVHAGLVIGVALLVGGLATSHHMLAGAAIWVLGPALLAFLIPVGWALLRTRASTETAWGMRLAIASLLLVAFLGLWMAHGHAGSPFPGDRAVFVDVHMAVGLLGWIGGLLVAVSFQVVPMFYLAEEPGKLVKRVILALLAVGVVAPPLSLVAGQLGWIDASAVAPFATWSVGPAVIAVWLLHPLVTLRGIARRRRRRADGSLLFWRAGMVMGPVVAVAALLAALLTDPRYNMLFGWLALWGWAGLVVHGMLTRIVPFLVWFHRFSALAGKVPIPSMRKLLPDRWTRIGFAPHALSIVVGAAAILTELDALVRIAGVLVAATGGSLGLALVRVLRKRPEAAA